MNNSFKTLVVGASLKPARYSNLAIRMLKEYGIETKAYGLRAGQVEGIEISTEELPLDNIHTVTVYVGQDRLAETEDYILSLNPKRIIFNPGAENPSFSNRAKQKGIEVVNACTLVMLRTEQFEV